MREVKLCTAQESVLQRQREESYKKYGWVTSKCHVKNYNATAGFYRRQLTSARHLGKWAGFPGKSEGAVSLWVSFSDKGEREGK